MGIDKNDAQYNKNESLVILKELKERGGALAVRIVIAAVGRTILSRSWESGNDNKSDYTESKMGREHKSCADSVDHKSYCQAGYSVGKGTAAAGKAEVDAFASVVVLHAKAVYQGTLSTGDGIEDDKQHGCRDDSVVREDFWYHPYNKHQCAGYAVEDSQQSPQAHIFHSVCNTCNKWLNHNAQNTAAG